MANAEWTCEKIFISPDPIDLTLNGSRNEVDWRDEVTPIPGVSQGIVTPETSQDQRGDDLLNGGEVTL